MTLTLFGFAVLTGLIIALAYNIVMMRLDSKFLMQQIKMQNGINKTIQELFDSQNKLLNLYWDYMKATDQQIRIMQKQINDLDRGKANKEEW